MARASFVFAALTVAAVACGTAGDGGDGGADPFDASADAPDAQIDVAIDAGCRPTLLVDEKLDKDLGLFVGHAYNASGYPRVEPFFGAANAGVLLPFTGPDTGPVALRDAWSGIWLPSSVPLARFDVELEAYVACTSPGASCADGLVVAWIDATDAGVLANANGGFVAGIPGATRGYAAVLDAFTNNDIQDPAAPSLQIAALDADKQLGKYPWVKASTPLAFLGAWHKLAVRVRGSSVDVSIDDGATTLAATGLTPIATGMFGIAGGTGYQTDAVAVRNVKASFYACEP